MRREALAMVNIARFAEFDTLFGGTATGTSGNQCGDGKLVPQILLIVR